MVFELRINGEMKSGDTSWIRMTPFLWSDQNSFVARLYWVYFRVEAACELYRVDLFGAPVQDALNWLRSKRQLVIDSYGEGSMGLLPDLSNLTSVSDALGFDLSRYPRKKEKVPKGALIRETLYAPIATKLIHRVAKGISHGFGRRPT